MPVVVVGGWSPRGPALLLPPTTRQRDGADKNNTYQFAMRRTVSGHGQSHLYSTLEEVVVIKVSVLRHRPHRLHQGASRWGLVAEEAMTG
ncbi:hypothetical protein Pmani_011796 [Petrolisthes manimaculis]|uniref:Uncharacterized protein n=1 Tax=Petrolisthes manimaculis TaxID=1843537 RepID=A0AAE1UAV1_9EUCA|nr:hypothetical protein Pmani_011796 [Petrolisthes manimaculis]